MTYALAFFAGTFAGSLVQHIAYRLGSRRRHVGPPVPLSEGQIIEAVRRGLIDERYLP